MNTMGHVQFIKSLFPNEDFIPLHAPTFEGNEKRYLAECIDSTFVSYVGKFVGQFEEMTAKFTGAKYAVATSSGTAALHVSLILCGVQDNDEVIAPALTFVATANAIRYCNALPLFADSSIETLGLDIDKLSSFLSLDTEIKSDGFTYNKNTGRRIKACVPMHTFGHPIDMPRLVALCDTYNIDVIEDAAESLGSYYNGQHTGTFGKMGILSYNGNKTITTGGGGMILTNDEQLAKRAKHITTTAKIPHPFEFDHDELGFNYRMTNVNAAIGVAQMEKIDSYLLNKRELAGLYADHFEGTDCRFFTERPNCKSNYWLNVLVLKDRNHRDEFLSTTNANGVMTRPIWKLMNKLDMYKNAYAMNLDGALWLEDRVVNIPSSVRNLNL
jgi:aminotransferase in exopolysaccharide biosynthesis